MPAVQINTYTYLLQVVYLVLPLNILLDVKEPELRYYSAPALGRVRDRTQELPVLLMEQ